MKVYALVGESGTGKSYKALNIAHKHNISVVIDDGLLIDENRLIGGKSAKREDTTIGAVKRAIFHYKDHRKEISKKIKKLNKDSILIIGTSDRMARKIAKNLDLGDVDEYIYISDISTKKEMEIAYDHRFNKGKHIIPLPSLELKRHFSGYLLNRIRHILKRDNSKEFAIKEKTVTRPTFSYIGKFSISDNALKEIIEISMKDFKKIELYKIRLDNDQNHLTIDIYVIFEYGSDFQNTAINLQKNIINNIYSMTRLNIEKCNVVISDLKEKI
ncbi:MAG: Asp23/Gls24 family envelope stress response protein [Bacillota bacterium]